MSASAITMHERGLSWTAKVQDYLSLGKPRIAVLVLVVVALSGYIAQWGHPNLFSLFHATLGTLFVASSASAMNQWLERERDARMHRTSSRPLPTGRLSNTEVLTFATGTVILGMGYLWQMVSGATAFWAGLSWLIYVAVYTPMKPLTTLNTAVGAIAGALPVLIGWSAAGSSSGSILTDPRPIALYFVVFLWQFPHFMAIAWIYRDDYRRAGLQMLTVADPTGRRAGVQAVLGALALLPVSLVTAFGADGHRASLFFVAAFLLGSTQLFCASLFLAKRDQESARRLLRVSLIYLPALLTFLVFSI